MAKFKQMLSFHDQRIDRQSDCFVRPFFRGDTQKKPRFNLMFGVYSRHASAYFFYMHKVLTIQFHTENILMFGFKINGKTSNKPPIYTHINILQKSFNFYYIKFLSNSNYTPNNGYKGINGSSTLYIIPVLSMSSTV